MKLFVFGDENLQWIHAVKARTLICELRFLGGWPCDVSVSDVFTSIKVNAHNAFTAHRVVWVPVLGFGSSVVFVLATRVLIIPASRPGVVVAVVEQGAVSECFGDAGMGMMSQMLQGPCGARNGDTPQCGTRSGRGHVWRWGTRPCWQLHPPRTTCAMTKICFTWKSLRCIWRFEIVLHMRLLTRS